MIGLACTHFVKPIWALRLRGVENRACVRRTRDEQVLMTTSVDNYAKA